ncbi:MAG: hypothetical protein ACHQJ4_04750 [Ignavibacteria bacterium]
MSPIIDLYDDNAHIEEGSPLWWYKRVDDSGNEILLGQVSYIKVNKGGTRYTAPPQINISGGGGNGATAEAIVHNGSIAAIKITNAGLGYISVPRVEITGNGSGAEVKAYISDGWHLGFARMKSDFDFGQDETPVYDEAKRFFAYKKNELKGTLKFTSLQDDFYTENFLAKEVHKYYWAIFQNAGLSRDNFNKYRYFGIVRIPRLYKSSAPGRAPELKGMVMINNADITVNSSSLPVEGLGGSYSITVNDGYSVQEEITQIASQQQ